MHGAPARNVSTRRKGPRPETRRRDLLGRDRDETLVRLETVSRPRRRDRDHIPAKGKLFQTRGAATEKRSLPNIVLQ